METMTKQAGTTLARLRPAMPLSALAAAHRGYQDPSVLLGTRCVQGDLGVTRGQVRPQGGIAVSPAPTFAIRTFVATDPTGTRPGGLAEQT